MGLIQELTWRGLVHDVTPGTEEQLAKELTSGYIGFDPTADSLHIGNLVPVFLLKHLQRAGHKPIVLVGGATGMVGDPSGKKSERQLLDQQTLAQNLEGQKKQLKKFLDFGNEPTSAVMVNNHDWFKEFSFLDFIRDVGKHISVSYMMAKDSVKSRLETGMSFTEFTYQLVQGYDFYHLYENYNCKLQMGGSDQWGNIVTGTELIRRKSSGQAFALTAPLLTKSDGSKFGKSEGGNIWLDPKRTSPYKFYQYWLNVSDIDAERFIKIFTFLNEPEIQKLIKEHKEAPHLRVLQKKMASNITTQVHGDEALDQAIKASQILFGKSTSEDLKAISKESFLSVFDGVPSGKIKSTDLSEGIGIIDLLVAQTGFLKSNGEATRALKENSIQVNKQRVVKEFSLTKADLINDEYVLLQRGKKNYFLVEVV